MTMARRRTLLILTGAVLLCGLLAGYAVWRRAAEGLPRYTSELFLPGFADRAGDAARIEVVGPNSAFTVIKESPTGWVLDRGNFPADFDEVRRTLISLAQLSTIAPKTERPDWLTHLSLGEPPRGNGTLLTVKDAQGAVLWSWAVPVAEGASSDTADRHIFNTASRIDASGAPVDFD